MKIALIIASILLIFGVTTPSEARLSTIFEPKEKDKDKDSTSLANDNEQASKNASADEPVFEKKSI